MYQSPSHEDISRLVRKSAPVYNNRLDTNLKTIPEKNEFEIQVNIPKYSSPPTMIPAPPYGMFEQIANEPLQQKEVQPKQSLMKYLHEELSNPYAPLSLAPANFQPELPQTNKLPNERIRPPIIHAEPIKELQENNYQPMNTNINQYPEDNKMLDEPVREYTPGFVEKKQSSPEFYIKTEAPSYYRPQPRPENYKTDFVDAKKKQLLNENPRKYRSMNAAVETENIDMLYAQPNPISPPRISEQKEIKIVFDDRIKLMKLINTNETIKEIILQLRKMLETKGYLYRNIKNALVLKDINDFELDENENIGYYLSKSNEFKLCFRKYGQEYSLTAEGSFDLLDIPEKIIDMKQENNEYKFRIAWCKRKNGVQPLPSYVTEKQLMCYNPSFLFDFYAGFAKRIVK